MATKSLSQLRPQGYRIELTVDETECVLGYSLRQQARVVTRSEEGICSDCVRRNKQDSDHLDIEPINHTNAVSDAKTQTKRVYQEEALTSSCRRIKRSIDLFRQQLHQHLLSVADKTCYLSNTAIVYHNGRPFLGIHQ